MQTYTVVPKTGEEESRQLFIKAQLTGAQRGLTECYKHEAKLTAQGSGNFVEAGKDIIF